MRIVFFGTPEFAVPSLRKLLESSHQVVAVVTQPDKPKGRGREIGSSPVKETARAAGIPLLQPDKMAVPEFLEKVKFLQPELAVVVAYGLLLPRPVLKLFRREAINLHPSLLPKYRGAAPIAWALINGEKETGVTIYQLDEQMDHGPILAQEICPIVPEETATSLSDKLKFLGSELLLKTVDLLAHGTAHPAPQEDSKATYAPCLKKEDGILDWKLSCSEIHNRVRGLQPWPGAMARIPAGKKTGETLLIKLLKTSPHPDQHDSLQGPGRVVTADPKKGLLIQTGKGQLRVETLQPEGGTVMEAAAFLRGHRISPGTLLTSSV